VGMAGPGRDFYDCFWSWGHRVRLASARLPRITLFPDRGFPHEECPSLSPSVGADPVDVGAGCLSLRNHAAPPQAEACVSPPWLPRPPSWRPHRAAAAGDAALGVGGQ
jgi:hypothetical protein